MVLLILCVSFKQLDVWTLIAQCCSAWPKPFFAELEPELQTMSKHIPCIPEQENMEREDKPEKKSSSKLADTSPRISRVLNWRVQFSPSLSIYKFSFIPFRSSTFEALSLPRKLMVSVLNLKNWKVSVISIKYQNWISKLKGISLSLGIKSLS